MLSTQTDVELRKVNDLARMGQTHLDSHNEKKNNEVLLLLIFLNAQKLGKLILFLTSENRPYFPFFRPKKEKNGEL